MENALYYTLSTIAQTLAGALAVLVAFVLFKLADLDRAMRQASFELQSRHSMNWRRLWGALCAHGIEGMDKERGTPEPDARLRAIYSEGGSASRIRPRITRVLSYALIGSVVDMSVCFGALPWTPSLASSGWAALVLLGTVSLGMICLVLYVWLIFMVAQHPEAPPGS